MKKETPFLKGVSFSFIIYDFQYGIYSPNSLDSNNRLKTLGISGIII